LFVEEGKLGEILHAQSEYQLQDNDAEHITFRNALVRFFLDKSKHEFELTAFSDLIDDDNAQDMISLMALKLIARRLHKHGFVPTPAEMYTILPLQVVRRALRQEDGYKESHLSEQLRNLLLTVLEKSGLLLDDSLKIDKKEVEKFLSNPPSVPLEEEEEEEGQKPNDLGPIFPIRWSSVSDIINHVQSEHILNVLCALS